MAASMVQSSHNTVPMCIVVLCLVHDKMRAAILNRFHVVIHPI